MTGDCMAKNKKTKNKNYKDGFVIHNFEGTKAMFLLLIEKLLTPFKPEDIIKVKMSLKYREDEKNEGEQTESA